MPKILAVGLLALLAVVPAAMSRNDRQQPQDGCLVVSGGNGTVTIWAQGGLIGRADQGTLTIEDLTTPDAAKPKVYGYETAAKSGRSTTYSGSTNLRFRVSGGGSFHVSVTGIGIDLSVIGQGRALLNGASYVQTGGSYSADAASLCVDNVHSFPTTPTKVGLGTAGSG